MRGIERVSQFLDSNRIDAKIVQLNDSTRTSRLAAEVLACSIAEIAKALVFIGARPMVVVMSGDKRVSIAKLKRLFGAEMRMASAQEVKSSTDYVIGGVPPFPHAGEVKVYADISLRRFSRVWAAAGEPNAVMNVAVEDILKTIGTEMIDVAENS